MTPYIAVHGTWDLGTDSWWRHGSNFCKLAAQHGLSCSEEFESFYWSGVVDGISLKSLFTLGFLSDSHDTWRASGLALKNRLRYVPLKDRNIIVHSHGLQVLAYASIEVNNIISVGSPIRHDLAELYTLLRNNSNAWMHIYDSSWDRMGILGQISDGKWFGKRNCPQADINQKLKGISHSRILRDEKYMQLWVEQGWFDFLKQK